MKNVNVTLSPEEISLLQTEIVDKRNIQYACEFCNVNYRTFKRAMAGKVIAIDKRDRLLRFAKQIKN